MKKIVSFIIPVFNEEATIVALFDGIQQAMGKEENYIFEILFVDDGSRDYSWGKIQSLSKTNPQLIRAIRFRRNFGKSQALSTGFHHAKGEILITMDADLQDEPVEIPKFLRKMEEGYDLVSGWKMNRHDPLSKTLPSKLFNFVTRLISGVKIHDFNCGFKSFRKEVAHSIKIYGDFHRYIPVLAHNKGFGVAEVSVHHSPRQYGKSKYGFERFVRGFLDLLTVIITTTYSHRPGHLFGGVGILMGTFGFFIILFLVLWKLITGIHIGGRPSLAFGIMLTIMSIQFISLGLLAELIVRQSNDKTFKEDQITEVIN